MQTNFNTELQHVNGNLSEIISKLTKVKRTGTGKFIACCPAHNDKSPSLGITLKPDGVILIHCFGCGASGVDVCGALGIDPAYLFPPTADPKYSKQNRSGFSAWQLLHTLHADLIRLLLIANSLSKVGALSADDREFVSEVVLRLNDGMSYLEGAR